MCATKVVKGPENKMYEEQLRALELFSWKKEAKGKPHCSLQPPEEMLQQGGCWFLWLCRKVVEFSSLEASKRYVDQETWVSDGTW